MNLKMILATGALLISNTVARAADCLPVSRNVPGGTIATMAPVGQSISFAIRSGFEWVDLLCNYTGGCVGLSFGQPIDPNSATLINDKTTGEIVGVKYLHLEFKCGN